MHWSASPLDNRYPGKRDGILFASVSPIPSTGSGAQKVLNKHLQNESAFCNELIHSVTQGSTPLRGDIAEWSEEDPEMGGLALGGGPGARLWSVMRTSRALGNVALHLGSWHSQHYTSHRRCSVNICGIKSAPKLHSSHLSPTQHKATLYQHVPKFLWSLGSPKCLERKEVPLSKSMS